VVGAQRKAVTIDGELRVSDGDLQCVAAPRALQVIPVGDGDAQSGVSAEGNALSCGSLRVDEVMGGAGVEERGEPDAVDIYKELHGAPRAGLEPGQGVDGDGEVGGVLQLLRAIILADHLDDEQLLAHLFMAISEEIVTVEALAVLASIGDFEWQQVLDGDWLGDRRCKCRRTRTGRGGCH
jgi:hypothetical protein